jgi:hypothetical protein
MKRLRPASPEEIKLIAPTSALDNSCLVLALDSPQGPIFAVVRTAIEVDPVIFPPDLQDRWKVLFMRDVETFLAAREAQCYHFNVHIDDTRWIASVEAWGAERTSTAPEYRYRKGLLQ